MTARGASVAGVAALVALLGLLTPSVGLGPVGWVVGLACAAVLVVAMAAVRTSVADEHAPATHRGRRSPGTARTLGPADLVTLSRCMLSCAVAALTAQAFLDEPAVAPLVGLAALALALDAVDGPVARRTVTASRFGAWFDGEVDAFLILVLSGYVARDAGWWVLAIGLMRYAFALAKVVWPRLRGRLPARYWRKVVAATQGVVLVVAASGLVPDPVTRVGLVVALVLLSESFGRDLVWLWWHGRRASSREAGPARAV